MTQRAVYVAEQADCQGYPPREPCLSYDANGTSSRHLTVVRHQESDPGALVGRSGHLEATRRRDVAGRALLVSSTRIVAWHGTNAWAGPSTFRVIVPGVPEQFSTSSGNPALFAGKSSANLLSEAVPTELPRACYRATWRAQGLIIEAFLVPAPEAPTHGWVLEMRCARAAGPGKLSQHEVAVADTLLPRLRHDLSQTLLAAGWLVIGQLGDPPRAVGNHANRLWGRRLDPQRQGCQDALSLWLRPTPVGQDNRLYSSPCMSRLLAVVVPRRSLRPKTTRSMAARKPERKPCATADLRCTRARSRRRLSPSAAPAVVPKRRPFVIQGPSRSIVTAMWWSSAESRRRRERRSLATTSGYGKPQKSMLGKESSAALHISTTGLCHCLHASITLCLSGGIARRGGTTRRLSLAKGWGLVGRSDKSRSAKPLTLPLGQGAMLCTGTES